MNICELLENTNNNSILNEENEREERLIEEEDAEGIRVGDVVITSGNEANLNSNSVNEGSVNNKEEKPGSVYATTEDLSKTGDMSSGEAMDTSEDEDEVDYNKMLMYFTIDSSDSQGSSNSSDNAKENFGQSILSSSNNNSEEEEVNFEVLGPYEKLCYLCANPSPSNMELASKYIVPALEFCETQEDYIRVFSYLRKNCFFSDHLLRSLWLEQIQNVIQYLHQEGDKIPAEFRKNFNMPNELALLISDLMQESNFQIKKYATTSLLCIVEKQLLDNLQIEKIIIPCLLNLVKENNEDFHIDCVSLFGKLAPLIGRELTSRYFLEPFCRLCDSPVFHTRKVCASNMVEIANVVSVQEVEQNLLPHFCEFMKDQVWAIRKVCAEIFSTFALKCSRARREQVLTDSFIRLLDDNSRWVKISAYKSLGSFISTFSKDTSDKNTSKEGGGESLCGEAVAAESREANNEENKENRDAGETNNTLDNQNNNNNNNETDSTGDKQQNESEYSNFMYWRNSLPSLEDKSNPLELTDKKENDKTAQPKNPTTTTNKPTSKIELLKSSNLSNPAATTTTTTTTTNMPLTYGQVCSPFKSNNIYSPNNSLSIYSNFQQTNNKFNDFNQFDEDLKQDVVPPKLLGYFLNMVEMNAQNSLDSEMNYNCAFNFPAIVKTLGAANWKYVKTLYKKLAQDNSWKVRQTLAYSIHELAIILDTELTESELVPIFDSYIEDVDEVRIGIVANLSTFLKVLSMDYRKSYMPKLNDFLKMDNQRNWRFRNELALQIAEFSELFPTDIISEYVQPITFVLALDKVSEVRITAVKALASILRQYELNNDGRRRRNFIDDVVRTFANNNKWSFRQLYAFLCETILKDKTYVDIDLFTRDFLPKLFSFRNDKVPNIRVCLARIISLYIITSEYFTSEKCPIANEIDISLQYLNGDKDSDVKMYLSCNEISQYQSSNTSNNNNNTSLNEQYSLPAYEDVLKQSLSLGQQDANSMNNDENRRQLEINVDRLNDSMNLINQQLMSLDDDEDDEEEEEGGKEGKSVVGNENNEVINDKIGRLKIVSMDEESSLQASTTEDQQKQPKETINDQTENININN